MAGKKGSGCGGPRGNKNALGNEGGRPREHDRQQIAKDLLEWAKLETSLNLNGFCAKQLIAPQKISQFALEDDMFRESLQLTKSILAERRERNLVTGILHNKAYEANLTVYDHFIKEDRREEKEFDASIKKDESKTPSEIVFRVNYDNDRNSVEISPKTLSDKDSKGSK